MEVCKFILKFILKNLYLRKFEKKSYEIIFFCKVLRNIINFYRYNSVVLVYGQIVRFVNRIGSLGKDLSMYEN